MSLKFKDQTILITGASSGIGQQVAYEAAQAGANLVLCARRIDRLEQVKRSCKKLGAQHVTIFSLDIGKPENIDELIDFLNIKNIHINVLINNAGFGHDAPFLETNFDLVLDLFSVNVLGLMYLTQKIAVDMLDQEKGQIINVASLAGKVSTPNYAAYDATKAAIISFSNALRMELKPFNIQITVVNFGPVDTPFFENVGKDRKEKAAKSPFTLSMEQAGKIVAKAIGTKKREVNRPILLALGSKIYPFTSQLVDYILVKHYNR